MTRMVTKQMFFSLILSRGRFSTTRSRLLSSGNIECNKTVIRYECIAIDWYHGVRRERYRNRVTGPVAVTWSVPHGRPLDRIGALFVVRQGQGRRLHDDAGVALALGSEYQFRAVFHRLNAGGRWPVQCSTACSFACDVQYYHCTFTRGFWVTD